MTYQMKPSCSKAIEAYCKERSIGIDDMLHNRKWKWSTERRIMARHLHFMLEYTQRSIAKAMCKDVSTVTYYLNDKVRAKRLARGKKPAAG